MGERFRRVPPTCWLMAITLLRMGLWLYRLGAQSFWLDEAFSERCNIEKASPDVPTDPLGMAVA